MRICARRTGGEYSIASDRYAFGALAYFVLTGQHPASDLAQLREGARAIPCLGDQPERIDHLLTVFAVPYRRCSQRRPSPSSGYRAAYGALVGQLGCRPGKWGALWDGCDAAVSSRLAYPEVRAALAAAGRAHRLAPDGQRQAEGAWEEFWSATRAVELNEAITAHAGQLTGEHALRGADAVHLASVLAVGAADIVLAVWDQRLRSSAAELAGVHVVTTQ
ncbi:MAG: hypothetical protein ACRDRA_09140 [Pseudonocardiaceae bacterium]